MTKQNIFRASLLVCGVALMNTACTFEQDDFFDEPASLRITHLNESLKNRLVSQSADGNHGWLIQYFVAGTDEADFEGFNLFGRFSESGKVTLAGNHRFLRGENANKYTEYTSTYAMLAEEGPVLSFDTWNDVLTVFEDPVDPTSKEQDGVGMYGDHNLVLRSFQENEVVFRGERHSAIVRFLPCDRPWQDYIAAVEHLKSRIAPAALNTYYVTNGTDTMYFAGLNRGCFNFCDRVVDPLDNTVLSCVFTPTGLRIESPDTLGNNSFQEFIVAADSTCLVNEDGTVRVIPTWDSYMTSQLPIWELEASMFSDEQNSLFTQIAAEIKKFDSRWSLKSIGFGKSKGGNSVNGMVLTCYVNSAKTQTQTLGMTVARNRVAYGQIEFSMRDTPVVDNNMNAAAKKATGLIDLTKQFAATLTGRYTVTPDHYFLPTEGTFTPVGEGTAFLLRNNN